jgi:uncharacterized membrane protein (UPF0127 family)
MSPRVWLAVGAVAAAIAAIFLYLNLQGPAAGQNVPMLLPVDPAPLVVETRAGKKSFTIEVADSEAERERGLMFREAMDDGHGMLFVFQATQRQAFWMKNTPMALDLIFIGQDGIVNFVGRGEPMSEAVVGSPDPTRFVLELKAGIAEKAGIEKGARVRHPAIDKVTGAAG